MYVLNDSATQNPRGNAASKSYYLVNMANNTTVMLTNSFGYSTEEVDGEQNEVANPALDQSVLNFTGVTYADMLKVQEQGQDAIAKNTKTFSDIVATAAKDSQLVNLSDFEVGKAPSPPSKPKPVAPKEVVDEA